MTIGYTTHWPKSMGPKYAGNPNHFVEKIWAGLIGVVDGINLSDYEKYVDLYKQEFGAELSEYDQMFIDAKQHTFREDPKDRWKVGMKIHPVINNRTKNRFQFAPVLEVKGIQKVEVIYSNDELCEWFGVEPVIKIDGRVIRYEYEYLVLAKNDGFKDVYQFLHWFNKDFTGKIIHWTNLKY